MSVTIANLLVASRVVISMMVILSACSGTSPPAGAERAPDTAALEAICSAPPPEVEGFEQDAQSYADAFGVTLEEATKRLSLQSVTGINEAGVAAAPELWAAGWQEHEPEFGHVLFYRGTPVDVQHVQAAVAGCSVPIIVRSGATFTERELLDGMERLTASGRLAPPMPSLSMWPDVQFGAIILGGPIDPGAEVLAEIESIAGVPVRYVEEPPATTR